MKIPTVPGSVVFQRVYLLLWSFLLLGIAVWQIATVGDWREANVAASVAAKDPLGFFGDAPRSSNAAASDMTKATEFAAVFTCGAALAVVFHVLKWNNATRHVTSAALLGIFSMQLVVLAYIIAVNGTYDKPAANPNGDLNTVYKKMGAAAIILVAVSAVCFVQQQICAVEYFVIEWPNMDDSSCCKVCCATGEHCSFGRFLVVAFASAYLALVIVRGAVAADLQQQLLDGLNEPNSKLFNLNLITIDFLYVAIIVSGVVAGIAAMQALHALWFWNAGSQNVAVVLGFIALAFETWLFGYAISHWEMGDDPETLVKAGGDQNDNDIDPSLDTIASLTLIAFFAQFVVWAAIGLFNQRLNSLAEASISCCQSKNAAAITGRIFVLVAVFTAFAVYLVRGALVGDISKQAYDMELDELNGKRVSDSLHANTASGWLVRASVANFGIGLGLTLYGLFHVFAWTRISAATLSAVLLVCIGLDIVCLGYGAKQAEFNEDLPSGAPEIDDTLSTIGALAVVQPGVNMVVLAITLIFTCGFNDSGDLVGDVATDDFTATAVSGETSDAGVTVTSASGSAAGSAAASGSAAGSAAASGSASEA